MGHFCEESGSVNDQRLKMVTDFLFSQKVASVLDLGCGSGALVEALKPMPQFLCILGLDCSMQALAAAQRRLNLNEALQGERLSLLHGSFLEVDERLFGFEAITLIETIEHIKLNQLSALERVVFICYKPRVVVITTPNKDFNQFYRLRSNGFRHPDHQFEWSRSKFQSWAGGVAQRSGYQVSFSGVGDYRAASGFSSQVAFFSR